MPRKAKKKPKSFDPVAHIFEHGLHRDVAKACGIKRQAVEQWEQVPWNRVLVVEKVTGIPRHKIRSDIYPAPK